MPYSRVKKFRSSSRKRPSSRYRRPARPSYRRSRYNTSKALGNPIRGPVMNFFPNSTIRKLKYVDRISIDAGLIGRAHHTFRSNSLFDPDYTGVGHQPRAFDQMMGAYLSYHVIASKITVTQLTAVSGSNSYMFLTHSAVQDPLISEAMDASALEVTALTMKPTVLADTTGTSRKLRVSRTANIKKFFKSKILSNPHLGGTAGANPTEQAYWTIYNQNIGGNDPQSMDFLVEIEYTAVFTRPNQIGSS